LSKEGSSWTPRVFLAASGAASLSPRFSPDGRWFAYDSTESGKSEVYVRRYPGADQRTKVSVGGGHDAVWSADRRELFYRNDDRFYSVPVTLSPTFSVGAPRLLFTGPYLDAGYGGRSYDVSRDGQRFLVVQVSDEERAPRRFHLIQNWFEELKTKVPTK
jgi:serine/threonine-protein kinase